MEAVCQTELSPELCSRHAENTLIIKNVLIGRKKTFNVEDTFIDVLTFQVVRKTRKEALG